MVKKIVNFLERPYRNVLLTFGIIIDKLKQIIESWIFEIFPGYFPDLTKKK
jgi:hypothetical protein